MIPLKLQLKNFISYGPQVQTINFEPYHLICLSGKNGHGKSALLDAITWVLWGQARKTANPGKADEGLLRLGQTHMMVVLDFQYNGLTYRARREYSINGNKGVSHLDFGIIDPQTQNLKPLTEKTIRATQEKINQVLCLDYESFTNSAFLRQGQSNEFSKKSARERKEVLARILGLERYEELRKKAAEKVRLLTQEKEQRGQLQQLLAGEIQAKEGIQAQLQDIAHALHIIHTQELELYSALQTLQQENKNLETQRQAYTKIHIMSEHQSTKLHDALTLLRTKVNTWRTIQREQKNLGKMQATTQEMQTLEKQLQELHTKLKANREKLAHVAQSKVLLAEMKEKHLKEHSLLTQEHNRVQSVHEAQQAQLMQQKDILTQKITALTNECSHLETEISKIEKESKGIAQLTKKLDQEEKLFERRKSFYHKFIMRGNLLKKESKELATKKEFVSTVQAQCPLCTQNLTPSLRTNLHTSFTQRQSLVEHQIRRIGTLLQSLKETLEQQHQTIYVLKQEYDNLTRSTTRNEELKKQYLTCMQNSAQEKKAQDALQQALQEIAALLDRHKSNPVPPFEKVLSSDSLYVKKREHITTQEESLKDHAALESHYETTKIRLTALTQESQKQQELVVQVALQTERKREIHELCLSIKTIKNEQKALHKQLTEFQSYESTAKNLENRIYEREEKLKAHGLQKETYLQKQGALLHHKTVLEQKEKEAQTVQKRMKELDDLVNQYQALAQAFSKDGIQALLIEEAIPEIEQEANILLAKLTDNQAHLIIESVRDLKSGATKETLDIKISDALGIRSYELFSGGEAFRIDFALRIAISKLLARRAGAALQMLIIDEGFGSQDEEGLAHITDALHKIQEEFNKVIVVSHLPSMKDQFPVQFFVQKNPQGSTVSVIEQG